LELEKSSVGTEKTNPRSRYGSGRSIRSELQQELTTEKTGFDILIETKDANLKAIMGMLKTNPNLTRREVMDKLGVSDRTATRYFGIIRKLKPKLLHTSVDAEIEAKAKRIEQMKKLMTEHPEMTREQVRKKIGVSRRTLYQYLASLEMVE
jgi:hypothetical protein